MRRAVTVLLGSLTLLTISAPAYAYAHDRVSNPYLHAALDVLTLAVVTAPLWTAFTWTRGKRSAMLLTLVALVQLPAAVIAFVPIADPVVHTLALALSLGVTVSSLIYVRREARVAARVTSTVR
jgi:hypothetical protein